jgi:hypothetical protein
MFLLIQSILLLIKQLANTIYYQYIFYKNGTFLNFNVNVFWKVTFTKINIFINHNIFQT